MEDYNKIREYLIDPEKYLEEYTVLEKNNIYDLMFLISWKTFILFCYQKIYQIRNLVGDELFKEEYWKDNDKDKNTKLDKIDKKEFYCYSCLIDEKLLLTIANFFTLDKNSMETLKIYKKQRDRVAHVSDKDYKNDEKDLEKFNKFIINIMDKISKKFNTEFLKNYDENWDQKKLSRHDENNSWISLLEHSKDFNDAENTMKLIEKNMDILSGESIKDILDSMIRANSLPYNQSIDAYYSVDFLCKILEKAKEIGMDFDSWKSFYLELNKQQQKKNEYIKKFLEQKGYIFLPKDIKFKEDNDSEDNPFN